MAFDAFERMMAGRYLRARRQEGFISVIAGFSLLGIALGVATLIIVMAVMNGFREELLGRILGLNGHLTVYGQGKPLAEYDQVAATVRNVAGVRSASPLVEGQVLATANGVSAGALVRGVRAGVVHVNTYGGADGTVPLGGVKQSGNGHDKSLHALDKYTALKTAWIQL